MFPWSPEFIWDVPHLAFFGSLYGVLLVVLGMLVTAALRTWKGLGRAESVVWHADFEELPAAARACRHQLTGEAPGRICDNGFDCRTCVAHPEFLARQCGSSHLQSPELGRDAVERLGLSMPLDRYYHRGHTWVQPALDGTVTVGLDALGRRLAGNPEEVVLPAVGRGLLVNGPVCRMKVRGNEVRVLAPVEGEVVEALGSGANWTLRVRPTAPLDVRHLLAGDEARVWLLREVERLEQILGVRDVGRTLADGGELVDDLAEALPSAQLDSVLAEMFLEP